MNNTLETLQVEEIHTRLAHIKYELSWGLTSYAKAKESAAPLLDELNRRSQDVAKRFNMPFRKITFPVFMR